VLIFRYLAKEVLVTTFAVLLVLLLVFMSGRFVGYLADAAAGELAANVLFPIMYYRLPNFIELILPLSFFIGIILAYGRLFVESEMVVMIACGMSQRRLLIYTLIPALLIAVISGSLSLYVSPAGEVKVEEILTDPSARNGLNTLAPGRFQSTDSSAGVFYTERLYSSRTRMKNVFVASGSSDNEAGDAKMTVVVAKTGKLIRDEETSARYIELYDGYQYQGNPGELAFDVVKFDTFATLMKQPETRLSRIQELDAVPTQDLFGSTDPKYQAALQWRLSMPWLVIISTMMAIGMSRTNHRKGRYTKMFPAILLYLGYFVSLTMTRASIADGEINVFPGMISNHLVAFIVGLLLVFGPDWWLKIGGRRNAK
jgi:lipopolysaccharide export system permease protein